MRIIDSQEVNAKLHAERKQYEDKIAALNETVEDLRGRGPAVNAEEYAQLRKKWVPKLVNLLSFLL